jgi:RNA-directed DNA polymerase
MIRGGFAATKDPTKYKASPLKRVLIPKSNSIEKRPLGIPTIQDRAVQAVYHLAVDPVVETRSDRNSYGFRKGGFAGCKAARCGAARPT